MKKETKITERNGFNHTPVVSFLQISGQLTFGKNLSKWGMGASISFDVGKTRKHCQKSPLYHNGT